MRFRKYLSQIAANTLCLSDFFWRVRKIFSSLFVEISYVLFSPLFVVVVAEAPLSPGPTPTEPPAASGTTETPAPSTFYSKKMPEKGGKRKGAPILNLFKRDTGPQRATTLEEALAAEVRTTNCVKVEARDGRGCWM